MFKDSQAFSSFGSVSGYGKFSSKSRRTSIARTLRIRSSPTSSHVRNSA